MKKFLLYLLVIVQIFSIITVKDWNEKAKADTLPNNTFFQALKNISENSELNISQIEKYLSQGLSFLDIQGALMVSERTNEPVENLLERKNVTVINNSKTLKGDVKVIDPNAVDLASKSSSRSSLTFPQKNFDVNKIITQIKSKTLGSPYLVANSDETYSSTTGGINVEVIDASLPGKNGMNFDLVRTYNSQSAQMYDIDIGQTEEELFFVKDLYEEQIDIKYYAKNHVQNFIEFDDGCDGYVEHREPEGPVKSVESQYYDTENDAYQANFDSNGSWGKCIIHSGIEEPGDGTGNPPPSPGPPPGGGGGGSEKPDPPPAPGPPPGYVCKGLCEWNLVGPDGADINSDKRSRRTRISTKALYTNQVLPVVTSERVKSGEPNFYGPYTHEKAIEVMNSIDPSHMGLSIFSERVTTSIYNKVVNKTVDKVFPIGSGWSWKVPYIETKSSQRFIHLEDGSSYEIKGTSLKGNPFNDYEILEDTTGKLLASDGKWITSKYVLKSIKGINQYFDQNGQIMYSSDSHGNKIRFFYTNHPLYGNVLSKIMDDGDNSINITYSSEKVEITNGAKKIIYKKTNVKTNANTEAGVQSTKEILQQVTNSLDETTTYDYEIKGSFFTLDKELAVKNNPYLLLKRISHPTGAKTVYEYENSPITRYLGDSFTNQSYRMKSRYDEVLTTAGNDVYNHQEYDYQGDSGSSYKTDVTFQTSINNYDYIGATKGILSKKTVYSGKKKYSQTLEQNDIYMTNIDEISGFTTKKTSHVYDEEKRNPYPIRTTINNRVNRNNTNYDSAVLSTSNEFNSYGLVTKTTSDLESVVNEYIVKDISYRAPSGSIENYKNIYTIKKNTVKKKNKNGQDEVIIDTNSYTYDGNGQTNSVISTTTSDGKIISKNESYYDTSGNITKLVDYQSLDKKSTRIIDYDQKKIYPISYRTSVTNVDGEKKDVTTYVEYQSDNGEISKITDANGNSIHFSYDLLDRVTKIIYKEPTKGINESPKELITYNSLDNEVITTNELGEKTKLSFNPLGWKVKESVYTNGVFEPLEFIKYSSTGQVIEVRDKKGNSTLTGYDGWDRPIVVKDLMLGQTSGNIEKSIYTYDDVTFTTTTTDSNNNSLETTKDVYGRVISQIEKWKDNSGVTRERVIEKLTYTGNDKVQVDGKGYNTSYVYDESDKLVSVLKPASNSLSEEIKTAYKYDFLGNVVTTTTGKGKKATKEYDELGRVIKKIDESGNSIKYYYDNEQNVVKIVDQNGQVIQQQFDFRNQLIQKEAFKNQENVDNTSFTYDLVGRKTSATNSTGTISYEYYSADDTSSDKYVGQMKKVIYPDQSSILYGYNNNGARTAMTVQIGDSEPWSVNYSYDVNNRLSHVTSDAGSVQESYQYQANGFLLSSTIKNHSQQISSFDGMKVSNAITNKMSDNTVLSDYKQLYDENNNIKTIIDSQSINEFSYDSLDRITLTGIGNEQYTYDKNGNRETVISETPIVPIGRKMHYDAYDRLNLIETDNESVDYRYNSEGLLFERTAENKTTRYYYDGNQIIAEATVSNDKPLLDAKYVRGLNQKIIAKVSEKQADKDLYGGVAYYHYNLHGDVTKITDQNSQTLNEYSYDVWGNPLEVKEKTSNPFRYSGEYYDAETNLQYLRARWYDPTQGRFISEDTFEGKLDDPMSLNLYTYVGNNPLKHLDPTGNFWETIIDIGSTIKSGVDFYKNPNWKSFGYLAWDVGALTLPFVPGSYVGKGANLAKGKAKSKNVVYTSTNADNIVQYVGITNNYARRSAEHLRDKGINIQPLMRNLSRSDARAVEQALIEIHRLPKNGGTLMNIINSISRKNPSYAKQLARGYELLKSIGYKQR